MADEPEIERVIEHIDEHLLQCETLFHQGSLQRVLEILTPDLAYARQKLAPSDPTYLSLILNLADTHLKLENFESGENLVRDYLKELGDSADPLVVSKCQNLLANLYFRAGRYQDAEATLLDSIRRGTSPDGQRDPALIPELYLLALLYHLSRRASDTMATLREMEEIERRVLQFGHPHVKEIGDMVAQASQLLRKPAPQSPSNQSQADESAWDEGVNKCLQSFVDHDFVRAASESLHLLHARPDLYLLEVHLISQIALGANSDPDEQAMVKMTPAGSWPRAMVEFVVGLRSGDQTLSLAADDDDRCHFGFIAGMLAVARRREVEARDCFRHALEVKSEIWEHRHAELQSESLDFLSRDIAEFTAKQQSVIQGIYRDFANCNWLKASTEMMQVGLDGPRTPQLQLLEIATLRAIGKSDLADSLLPHARRQMLRWPWHARLVDLAAGRVSAASLLVTAVDAVRVCQLRYYAMVRDRLSGHWEEAAFHREEALKTGAPCPERELAELDSRDPATMLDNVNRHLTFLIGVGDLETAGRMARASFAAARRVSSIPESTLESSLLNLATILGLDGKLSEAFRLFEETEGLPNFSPKSRFRLDLNAGQLYMEHAMHRQARHFLNRAWETARSTPVEAHEMAVLCNALGMLAFQAGDRESSLQWYQRAVEVMKQGSFKDALLQAAIADNIGICFSFSQQFEKALSQHQEAYDLLLPRLRSNGGAISDSHPSMLKVLMNLASALFSLGKQAEAEERAMEALRRSSDPQAESKPVKISVLQQLALILAGAGRMSEALERLVQASSLEDQDVGELLALSSEELRMTYAPQARAELSLLLSIAAPHFPRDSGRLEPVLDIVLRRKSLAAQASAARRDAVLGGRYPTLVPLLQELAALQEQAAWQALMTPDQAGENAAQRARIRQIEVALAKEIPEMQLAVALRGVTARKLYAGLPGSWSVIEFVRVRVLDPTLLSHLSGSSPPLERYFAFVVPSAQVDALSLLDLGPADELDRVVAEYLGTLGDDDTPWGKAARNAIRDRLVSPLFSTLPGVGHILVAPDGALARLPFEILPALDDSYLIDHRTFSYVSTSRDVARFVDHAAIEAKADLVIADPDFDFSPQGSQSTPTNVFQALPGTRAEGHAIAGLLGVEPVLGADALKSRLKQVETPRILHIATHGFTSETAGPATAVIQSALRGLDSALSRAGAAPLLRSGLALAGANRSYASGTAAPVTGDGLLSEADISALNLLGTQLVVLSACDTGRGEIHATEGVMGIRRAFQLAGAGTVVVSLWKLPDEQTVPLMTGFYRRLLRGMSRVDALRAAQLELRSRFPSPFYWGAFVCFGEVGPIRGMELMWGARERFNRKGAYEQEREVQRLSQVLARNPLNAAARVHRGIAYHNLYRPAEAIADFDRAAELAPNQARIFFSRGFSYHSLMRFEDAIRDFDRALELDPNFAPAFHRRGNSYSGLGDHEAALRDLTRAIELDGEDPDEWYDRAGLFADTGEDQKALADYSEAIRLNPSFETAYVNRSSVFMAVGDISHAAADLETALQLDPYDALAHLNLGSVSYLAGDRARAIQCWDAAARYGKADVILNARRMISEATAGGKGGDPDET